ncbi:MAG: HEAT repeat domain-containing protein, partial [Planctomycetota bacterium]
MPSPNSCRCCCLILLTAISSQAATNPFLSANEVAGRNLAGWKKDLSSDNRTVRLRAVKTLGAFDAEAVPTLTELLGDQDVAVQYWAASHLGNIGSAAKSSVPALKGLFGSDSQPLRMAVSYALCSIEGVDEWSKPLLEGIDSKQREVGCTAADFLARLGPKAKSILGEVEAKHQEYLPNKGDY